MAWQSGAGYRHIIGSINIVWNVHSFAFDFAVRARDASLHDCSLKQPACKQGQQHHVGSACGHGNLSEGAMKSLHLMSDIALFSRLGVLLLYDG
eukprot:scaffold92633_cov22-Prasinocladus_malaysianus.AAC.1